MLSEFTIIDIYCTNSHWPANWAAKSENCQCGFSCTISIRLNNPKNGYPCWHYRITEKDYKKLIRDKKVRITNPLIYTKR